MDKCHLNISPTFLVFPPLWFLPHNTDRLIFLKYHLKTINRSYSYTRGHSKCHSLKLKGIWGLAPTHFSHFFFCNTLHELWIQANILPCYPTNTRRPPSAPWYPFTLPFPLHNLSHPSPTLAWETLQSLSFIMPSSMARDLRSRSFYEPRWYKLLQTQI